MAAASPSDNFINNNDGTYLIDESVAATLDFGDFSINSMTLTSSAADAISFTGNAVNDRMSVKNLSAFDTTIAAGHADTTLGLSLDSLKILGADELTTELSNIYQDVVDTSITTLNLYRGDIGSTQNQVESAVRNLMTQATNVKAAESIIRDVDYASESANFNKQNIIAQAGTYAISQANATSQNVLRLLQ